MENDNILLVAASKSDPARLEVHLNQFTEIQDSYNLSILEINFPGESIFFSPGVDYIEIQKSISNKSRKKRFLSSENNHKIYQAKVPFQLKFDLSELTLIKLSNFFPWVWEYQNKQSINDNEFLKILFHPHFSIKCLSELLSITYIEAVMKYIGAISFCLNLNYIKKNSINSLWPKNIKKENLEIIGFKPRQKSNQEIAQTFYDTVFHQRIENLESSITRNLWSNWYVIFENIFNNKIEENAKNQGISIWNIIVELNDIISIYYDYLNHNADMQNDNHQNTQENTQVSKRKTDRSISTTNIDQSQGEGDESQGERSEGEIKIERGEVKGESIINTEPTSQSEASSHIETTSQPNTERNVGASTDASGSTNASSQTLLSGETSQIQPEISLQTQNNVVSASLHFGVGTRKYFSVDSITSFFNNNQDFFSRAKFDEISQKLTLVLAHDEKVVLHGKMSEVLSLPQTMTGSNTYISTHCIDKYINNRLYYIYCDISKHIALGENYAPLVQIFSPFHKGIKKNHTNFPAPIFVPIAENSPKKINLVVYNEVGEKVKFLSSQPSTAKILLSKNGNG